MATETVSFRAWLGDQIREVLSRKQPQPPFLVWCDPERVWREGRSGRVALGEQSPRPTWPPGVLSRLVRV